MSRRTRSRPVPQRPVAVLLGAALGLVLLPGAAATGPAAAGEEAAPETLIVRHPVDPTTSRRAIFEQRSPTTSSFQCRLDRRKWRGCWIEVKYKGLDPGEHLFRVRAVEQGGATDPTPARFRWTILEPEEDAAGAARVAAHGL